MWLLLAFLSAALLGFYDVFKKQSLKDNAVLPVLFLNTIFSSLIFLPFILLSVYTPDVLGGTMFEVYCNKVVYCSFFVDIRLFRNETFTVDHCRAY